MKASEVVLTAERLRNILTYDPSSGVFRWINGGRNIRRGQEAGATVNGYRVIQIDGRRHYGQRLAWLYTFGRWPTDEIDHINGDPSDNKLQNLRDVTRSANMHNQRHAHKGNKWSQLLGAHWNSRQRAWTSSIRTNGRLIYLGVFATDKDAHDAYVSAKRALHSDGCTI